jgi:DNA-binding MarR family transcriptional regulator
MRTTSQRPSRSLERLEGQPPEEAIPHLLKSLGHSLRQAVEERLRGEKLDVSFAHFVTMFALVEEPGLPGAELARRAFVTAQTMNTILHRLERDGRIERRPHPSRARADSWFVTRKGQAQLDKAKIAGASVWRTMLSALGPREVEQLQTSLQKCLQSLEAQSPEETPKPATRRARKAGSTKARKRVSG